MRIPAVVSITIRDALEGNVYAACQHGIGVQILTDVSVSLRDAPKDNCREETLAQTLAMLDVVNSHAVQGPSAIQTDLVVEACGVLNKRTAPQTRSAREDTVSQSNWKKDRLLMDTTEEEAHVSSLQSCARTVSPGHQHWCTTRGRKILDCTYRHKTHPRRPRLARQPPR